MHEIHNHPVSCPSRWNLRLAWQFTVYKVENFARTCTSRKALPLLSQIFSHARHKQTPRSIYVATAFSPYPPFSCARHAWLLRLVYVAGDLCERIAAFPNKFTVRNPSPSPFRGRNSKLSEYFFGTPITLRNFAPEKY